MSDLVERCRRYAAVINGIVVVPDDWQPGEDHREVREPRTTLNEAADEIECLRSDRALQADKIREMSDERDHLLEQLGKATSGLEAAIRAANLALFVIRKEGVMPNSSWETGFNGDMETARASRNAVLALSDEKNT